MARVVTQPCAQRMLCASSDQLYACRASKLQHSSRLYANIDAAGNDVGDRPHPEDEDVAGRIGFLCGKLLPIRVHAWNLFSDPTSSTAAYLLSTVILLFIMLSTALLCAESMPSVAASEGAMAAIAYMEAVCIAAFTVEYVVKLWAAPNRFRFVCNLGNVLDLVSVLPWYLQVGLCGGAVVGCSSNGAVNSAQVRTTRPAGWV